MFTVQKDAESVVGGRSRETDEGRCGALGTGLSTEAHAVDNWAGERDVGVLLRARVCGDDTDQSEKK